MSSILKRLMNYRIIALIFVVTLSTTARADLFESWGVVENNSGMPGVVASKLTLAVTDAGSDQVLFTFNHIGDPSDTDLDFYIADVYFDDGALLGIASIDNSDPGVSFNHPATPGDLPGGNTVTPAFVTSGDEKHHFSADSDSPVADNGVGPGESLGIVFDLLDGKTFNDVINAIYVGFDPLANYGGGAYDGWKEPSLRIGIHVQGIDGPWEDDASDTYILTPVPGAFLLGMLGMGVAGMKLRKYA